MNNTNIGEDGWIGNPYTVVDYGRDRAVDLFERDFYNRIESDDEFREAVEELEGETLGCHCKPKSCHGDVIKNYLENNRTSLFEY